MFRRIVPAALALSLAAGCAGPTKLAERSEEKLAGGQQWRAWELATRALDKEPGNARARAAASAAAVTIAQDWHQRIRALADADSVAAAEQVLEFAAFRAGSVRYAAVQVDPGYPREEQLLRGAAARLHYRTGTADLDSRRPKRAYLHFTETERFSPGYRDAARLANRAYEQAITRVAVLPFRTSSATAGLGREVAAGWRDELARRVVPPEVQFTRLLGSDPVEQAMTVSQLGGLSRSEALRLGRKAGAERVVWGSIGGVQSDTRTHVFTDVIARRIAEKDGEGHETTRWVDVPIEVVARVRTVTVPVEYEIAETRGGATLAHQSLERSTSARVVWTSYAPEGDLGSYALVSETLRAADPERAKRVETRWKSVCGEKTTLREVLEARRSTRSPGRYRRDVLPRFISGAAFVFLEDLPPVDDLAYAALAGGWKPLQEDLVRLDAADDVDLGVATTGDRER